MTNFNLYCDESCHLEKDGINVMVLGAVWCPNNHVREINSRIREIKARNGYPETGEMKWIRLSPGNVQMYIDLVDYFFDAADLHFRALVVPDKSLLDHERFNQTHDQYYYKMYFDMLKTTLSRENTYEIYIDVKDSHTNTKAQKLREVCSNNMYDFEARTILKLQPIRSHEVQIMQIVDVLIGALGYNSRNFVAGHVKSDAKLRIIEQIKRRSGYSLDKSTLLHEEKFNLFFWEAR
jgi:hypothetical protein